MSDDTPSDPIERLRREIDRDARILGSLTSDTEAHRRMAASIEQRTNELMDKIDAKNESDRRFQDGVRADQARRAARKLTPDQETRAGGALFVAIGCMPHHQVGTGSMTPARVFDIAKQLSPEDPPMYHAIVKRIATKNFEYVNDKNYDALLKGCAPNIHHRFGGDHALGGQRHDKETLRRWFERLGRVMPGLRLTIGDVWVKGLPHHTTIIIRWTAAQTLLDGSHYKNHGVHVIRMRWGKVVSIDANEDSQVVAEALTLLAAHGVAEAIAEPIVS